MLLIRKISRYKLPGHTHRLFTFISATKRIPRHPRITYISRPNYSIQTHSLAYIYTCDSCPLICLIFLRRSRARLRYTKGGTSLRRAISSGAIKLRVSFSSILLLPCFFTLHFLSLPSVGFSREIRASS